MLLFDDIPKTHEIETDENDIDVLTSAQTVPATKETRFGCTDPRPRTFRVHNLIWYQNDVEDFRADSFA